MLLSRRHLLKMLGASAVFIATPFERLLGVRESAGAQTPGQGELYAGFVLLPAGAPVPAQVQYPPMGIPIFCGVGGQTANAISLPLANHTVARDWGRLSLYTVSNLPPGAFPAEAEILEYESGAIFGVSLTFRSSVPGAVDEGPSIPYGSPPAPSHPQAILSLWAQAEFPHPFPFWDENASASTISPTKVNFLPSSGIQVETASEYSFYWISAGVLYRLVLYYHPSQAEAQRVASSLIPFR
ncbi:MAG: hypothetical protein ACRDFX_02505 [Chloroflexota bacterium]